MRTARVRRTLPIIRTKEALCTYQIRDVASHSHVLPFHRRLTVFLRSDEIIFPLSVFILVFKNQSSGVLHNWEMFISRESHHDKKSSYPK